MDQDILPDSVIGLDQVQVHPVEKVLLSFQPVSYTHLNDGNGTLARSRKDSFYWYKKVIASNGTDLA